VKYLIFDTETGGFSPKEDALMSLAIIVVNEKLEEISRFYSLVKNTDNKTIGEKALEINKIPVENLESGLSIPQLREVWRYMSEGVDRFIAHNIAFDIGFLRENGFEIPKDIKTLDTMHVAWDFWGSWDEETQSHISARLEVVYTRIGKIVQNAHNSLYDCEMILDVLEWLTENKHIKSPLASFPIIENYRDHKAFGYKQMKNKGLL
jgi:DNA polymerase III epsilon subunit-like protein